MCGGGNWWRNTHLARAADPTAHRRVRNFGLRDLRIIMGEEGGQIRYVDENESRCDAADRQRMYELASNPYPTTLILHAAVWRELSILQSQSPVHDMHGPRPSDGFSLAW